MDRHQLGMKRVATGAGLGTLYRSFVLAHNLGQPYKFGLRKQDAPQNISTESVRDRLNAVTKGVFEELRDMGVDTAAHGLAGGLLGLGYHALKGGTNQRRPARNRSGKSGQKSGATAGSATTVPPGESRTVDGPIVHSYAARAPPNLAPGQNIQEPRTRPPNTPGIAIMADPSQLESHRRVPRTSGRARTPGPRI